MVKDIEQFRIPESLKTLRSFLGLSGFYRRFHKDYAKMAKPLTKYLHGENGHMSAKKSGNVKIQLHKEALSAFGKLRMFCSPTQTTIDNLNSQRMHPQLHWEPWCPRVDVRLQWYLELFQRRSHTTTQTKERYWQFSLLYKHTGTKLFYRLPDHNSVKHAEVKAITKSLK